jgi:hypothetical protein
MVHVSCSRTLILYFTAILFLSEIQIYSVDKCPFPTFVISDLKNSVTYSSDHHVAPYHIKPGHLHRTDYKMGHIHFNRETKPYVLTCRLQKRFM